MSEPQQPPVPPTAPPHAPAPPAPPAAQLPAAPQYPAAPQAHPQQQFAPPQQHNQQQYNQQQYNQQQYNPQQPYAPQPRATSGPGNPLARTAFIVALIVAAVGALQILLQPFVLASFDYSSGSFGAYSFIFAVLVFFGSAAALVLGLIALRRPGGHALAGIAIGVGGVQLIGIVLGWISSLFYTFF